MSKVYGLMSDQHAHNWSQFAGVDGIGCNTRLREILSEMVRCADTVLAAGGDTIVFGGDLFHTRGAIAPEVFNPTYFTIKEILARGIRILAIPGNHDLASKETTELGNAMQSLAGLEGFFVTTKPTSWGAAWTETPRQHVMMIPWISTIDALKKAVENAAQATQKHKIDLVIHAGIDGVLSGVPGHDLSPAYLAGLGFKRVFAGHYHHHCVFEGGKVVSIGATGHQTFSDIGTKAGFLLVHEDRIQHFASHCPSFVEVTGATPEEDVPLIVDGNYVRVRGMKLTDRQINDVRKSLIDAGARGVSFQVERVTEAVRAEGVVKAAATLEDSLGAFVKSKGFANEAAVSARCAQILSDVRAAGTS